jgi:hypothetical protein
VVGALPEKGDGVAEIAISWLEMPHCLVSLNELGAQGLPNMMHIKFNI